MQGWSPQQYLPADLPRLPPSLCECRSRRAGCWPTSLRWPRPAAACCLTLRTQASPACRACIACMGRQSRPAVWSVRGLQGTARVNPPFPHFFLATTQTRSITCWQLPAVPAAAAAAVARVVLLPLVRMQRCRRAWPIWRRRWLTRGRRCAAASRPRSQVRLRWRCETFTSQLQGANACEGRALLACELDSQLGPAHKLMPCLPLLLLLGL